MCCMPISKIHTLSSLKWKHEINAKIENQNQLVNNLFYMNIMSSCASTSILCLECIILLVHRFEIFHIRLILGKIFYFSFAFRNSGATSEVV